MIYKLITKFSNNLKTSYSKHHKTIILLTLFFFVSKIEAQNKRNFKVHTVAFYNVENLFDTINDTTKFDERSPMMELKTELPEAIEEKGLHIHTLKITKGLNDSELFINALKEEVIQQVSHLISEQQHNESLAE